MELQPRPALLPLEQRRLLWLALRVVVQPRVCRRQCLLGYVILLENPQDVPLSLLHHIQRVGLEIN